MKIYTLLHAFEQIVEAYKIVALLHFIEAEKLFYIILLKPIVYCTRTLKQFLCNFFQILI